MTKETFLKEMSFDQVREFFISLEDSTQWEIFSNTVAESNPDSTLYNFDMATIGEMFSSVADAFSAGAEAKINWADGYFYFDGYGHIVTIDSALDYFLDHLDEMEGYIKENYEDEMCNYFDFEEDEEEDEEED